MQESFTLCCSIVSSRISCSASLQPKPSNIGTIAKMILAQGACSSRRSCSSPRNCRTYFDAVSLGVNLSYSLQTVLEDYKIWRSIALKRRWVRATFKVCNVTNASRSQRAPFNGVTSSSMASFVHCARHSTSDVVGWFVTAVNPSTAWLFTIGDFS